MTEALEKRGVPDLTASLAAELGMRAFDLAFARWANAADAAGQRSLPELTAAALSEVQATMVKLA